MGRNPPHPLDKRSAHESAPTLLPVAHERFTPTNHARHEGRPAPVAGFHEEPLSASLWFRSGQSWGAVAANVKPQKTCHRQEMTHMNIVHKKVIAHSDPGKCRHGAPRGGYYISKRGSPLPLNSICTLQRPRCTLQAGHGLRAPTSGTLVSSLMCRPDQGYRAKGPTRV